MTMTTARVFSRVAATGRAEACRNAADSYRQTLSDYRALLCDVDTEEQRRIALSFITITESHIEYLTSMSEAYENAGKQPKKGP